MTERWTERRGVAMHEAGHAVVAFLLGRAFRYVSINPDKDTFGRVHIPLPRHWFRPDIEVTGRGRVLIEDRIMILLARVEAEDAWCRTVSGKPRDWKTGLSIGADFDQRVLTLVGSKGVASSDIAIRGSGQLTAQLC